MVPSKKSSHYMKKINSCILSSLLLALLCIGAESPSVVALRPAPHGLGDIVGDASWAILPRSDIYEVGASRLELSSIRDLPAAGFREIKEPGAIAYTGDYYRCPAGKRPYLVRAVYGVGGFGKFRAERRGNSLAIIWGDLMAFHIDRLENYRRSAVVVNLDFTPDEVYNEFSTVP
jgi:hypothetical protein